MLHFWIQLLSLLWNMPLMYSMLNNANNNGYDCCQPKVSQQPEDTWACLVQLSFSDPSSQYFSYSLHLPMLLPLWHLYCAACLAHFSKHSVLCYIWMHDMYFFHFKAKPICILLQLKWRQHRPYEGSAMENLKHFRRQCQTGWDVGGMGL